MLRSRRVSLMTVGGMVVLVGVAGCDEKQPPPPPSFGSVEQCMLAGNVKADCEAAADKVAAEHLTSAPKYADPRSCEAIHGVGNCEPRRTGSGLGEVFMPAMAGFILGQALSGGGFAAPQPIYRDPRGYAYLPGQAPWMQRPAEPEQGRGRSVWGDSSWGSSGGGSGGGSGSTTARGGAAPSSVAAAPSAPSAQRGVLGTTGRSSATSVSAGS